MLPKCETIGDEALETYVTEEIYEIPSDGTVINLSGLMADKMIIWTYSCKIWCIATSYQEVYIGRPGRHLSGY